MSAADNKQLMQHVFDEVANGNSRPFIEALADDIRWTNIGSTAWSGTFAGKQAVLDDLLTPVRDKLAHRNKIVTHRFIAEGDYVVIEGRGENLTKSGAQYNNTYCWVCRLADGKVKEITEYMDTQLVAQVLGNRK